MVERHGTTGFQQRPVGFRIDVGRGLGLGIEQQSPPEVACCCGNVKRLGTLSGMHQYHDRPGGGVIYPAGAENADEAVVSRLPVDGFPGRTVPTHIR